MTAAGECIEELKTVNALVDFNMKSSEAKIQFQHKIYTDLYRIFVKHGNKLATLANAINEEVLGAANQEELVVQYYQMLSNSLLRLADCSRRVSLRFKSQVLDPLKTFNENYQNLYEDIRKKIEENINTVMNQDQQSRRYRDSYNQACEKFEKHRDMQKKIIEKIESGNKSELDKFNTNTKRITENITSSEKYYHSAVEKLNQEWDNLRKQFAHVNQSISYNEDTRLAFFRKTVVNSIKTLEEFNGVYDPDIIRKIQSTTAKQNGSKQEELGQKKMRILLQQIIGNDFREEFVSFDEMMKSKRRKETQEENNHLSELFSRIKERQKKLMESIINPWFASTYKKGIDSNQQTRQTQQQQPSMQKTMSRSSNTASTGNLSANLTKMAKEIDECKQKVIYSTEHAIYFIQYLYQKVTDMNSFYCKLSEDNFIYLLNAFTIITKKTEFNNDMGIEFIYKMMHISQRVKLNRQNSNQQGFNQPIELLCQRYGKDSPKFKEPKLIAALLSYIEKRKAQKKKQATEGKASLNSIAKGIFAALTTKRAPILTDQQQYNCLHELIVLVANFSIPNEIILPFIKEALGNSHQSSYDYLKGVILNKKDVEERQSLFYKKEIKQKKELLLKRALQNKKMSQYAIAIVAQHGFLGKEQLKFRIICKELKNIHWDILARLHISTYQKWIRLIPVDNKLNYINMKQEVAENSVPSAIEEIITLDVNRSLHLHGQCLNPTILHSLLRIYAYFHKDISYCQGMNYLAGYLYIKTMNEQYTYRIFEYLMEIRFKQIFANEFQVLKVKMYQFQRLLSIYHPQISEHFKRQSISPECYIVSWIITLFASSYQYTLSSYLIDFLWERFIIWGWPEFFRFVLWIFSLFKEDLMQMTYDRALHFLGELGRSEMFLSDSAKFKDQFKHIQDPKVGIERYQVSQQLLNKFAQEYSLDK